jgi:hypothetical protein
MATLAMAVTTNDPATSWRLRFRSIVQRPGVVAIQAGGRSSPRRDALPFELLSKSTAESATVNPLGYIPMVGPTRGMVTLRVVLLGDRAPRRSPPPRPTGAQRRPPDRGGHARRGSGDSGADDAPGVRDVGQSLDDPG